jgi:RimJ/RimL family protein N-acetyltransferase
MNLWGDSEVTHLIGGPFSAEKVQARLDTEIAAQIDHNIQYYPFFLKESSNGEEVFVGCCGLRLYPANPNMFEIGFHLCKAFWGKGYASEAAQGMIHYAFETFPRLTGLFAGHNPQNESSRHLLLKLGFQFTHEEFYAPTGLMHPSYVLHRSSVQL